MARADTQKLTPIHLVFEDKRDVVVTPENKDRFMTTVQEAATACKRWQDQKEWGETVFTPMLGHLNSWCRGRAQFVKDGYLVIGEHGLRFFVVTIGADDFRFDFSDDVSALDIELAKKFPTCLVDVLQIPESTPESLRTFLTANPVQVYGQSSRASSQS